MKPVRTSKIAAKRHNCIRRAIVMLICSAQFLSPEIALGGGPATNPPGPCDTCPCDSPPPTPPTPPSPPDQPPRESGPGPEGPSGTEDPVILRQGAVVESAVDLELPGPVFSWSQSRRYRHVASAVGFTRLGNRWFDGIGDFRISGVGTGSPAYAPNGSLGDDNGPPADYTLQLFNTGIPLWRIGSTNDFRLPSDSHFTVQLDPTRHEFVVREKYSDKIFIFYSAETEGDTDLDGDPASDSSEEYLLRGRLKEVTTRQWYDATPKTPGWQFDAYSFDVFNDDARLMHITTPAPQNYSIEYAYDDSTNPGCITSVVVKDDNENEVMRAVYIYRDDPSISPSDDIGTSGDLVQVTITQKDSGGNDLTRHTQYRYLDGGYEKKGVLKAVYEHSAVAQMMADFSKADPMELLELDDDATGTSGMHLQDYSNRSFEYQFDPSGEDTTSVDTGWLAGGSIENLVEKYGGPNGADYNDVHEYRVMVEHIGSTAGCIACSGSNSSQITRTYHYVRIEQGNSLDANQYTLWHRPSGSPTPFNRPPDDINEVTMLVIEDTFAHDDETNYPASSYPFGRPLYRKIYGLNDFNRKLREVVIQNPLNSEEFEQPISYWCWAWTYVDCDGNDDNRFDFDNGDGSFLDDPTDDKPHLKHRIAEYRLPSAYSVTSNSELEEFLDPYDDPGAGLGYSDDETSSGWGNDNARLRDSDGVIYVYEYNNVQGLRTDEFVKKGQNGTPQYISATDWGDGSSNQPLDRIVAAHTYQAATVERAPTAPGIRLTTTYEYRFWNDDNQRLKQKVTKLPIVTTSENGPNSQTQTEEYYDRLGHLRWTKDGEGHVDYFSYNPSTGGQAYSVIDVDPGAFSSSGNSHWLARPTEDSGDPYDTPSRGTGLPTSLVIDSAKYFDTVGRVYKSISPGWNHGSAGISANFVAHEAGGDFGGTERTIYIRNYHASPGPNQPVSPISVIEKDQDRLVAKYTLSQNFSLISSSGAFTGLGATIDIDDCNSLTLYKYDNESGRLSEVRQYHNCSGDSEFANYYSTRYLYDAEGRVGATVQDVESGKYQVTVILYDVLGRSIEVRRGVLSEAPDDYAELAGSSPFIGFAIISKTTYDSGGIGDGHVSGMKHFFGAGANDYVDTLYHRTNRGHLRGIERHNGPSIDVRPYSAFDVDWMGRTTAAAQYISEPTWSTLRGNYDAWVNTSAGASGRYSRTISLYDVLGRVYRTESYPGTAANPIQVNSYFDLNGRLVCKGERFSAHEEYAYDGAGRQFQTRTILNISSPAFDSGKFDFRQPKPNPVFATMSGGNENVFELSHTSFDAAGNAIDQHEVELNHDDANGFSLTSGVPTGGVRVTNHHYFDFADRLVTSVKYGAADHNDGAVAWKSSDLPTRDTGTSTSFTSSTDRLVTQYSYDSAGRLQLVADPANSKTKTFYDSLGRRTYVAENQDNFEGAGDESDIGGGTNNEKDRVTKWQYNGLGQIKTFRAYNGSGSTQDTVYFYLDPFDASLVTNTIYPDSTETTPVSQTALPPFDQVRIVYNRDGTVKSRTDQRGVVMNYGYDSARRMVSEFASTIPSGVDSSVRQILREYDSLGRLTAIGSYNSEEELDEPDDGSNVNYIAYSYGTHGRVTESKQFVGSYVGSYKSVQYAYDATTDGTTSLLKNGLRLQTTTYPNSSRIIYRDFDGDDSVSDRLGRIYRIRESNSSGAILAEYAYNGLERVVRVDYPGPAVRRDMFDVDSGGANNYDGFDRFGRIVRQEWLKHSGTPAVRDRFDYVYDYAGNPLVRSIPNTLTSNWYDMACTYDGLHRLATFNQGNYSTGTTLANVNFREKWSLDQLGNWSQYGMDINGDNVYTNAIDLLQDRLHNSVNEIDNNNIDTPPPSTTTISAGAGQENWADPIYDKAGNTTNMPRQSSPTSTFAIKYDPWNRMTEVRDSSNNLVQVNEYDALGRRILKSVYSPPGTPSHQLTYCYNEDWQLVEEYKSGTYPLNQYVWHPYYIDALAVRYFDANTNNNLGENADGKYFYCHDANYNVRAIVKASGDVAERGHYTPYGWLRIFNGDSDPDGNAWGIDPGEVSDVGNTHWYTGRELDPETKLQLNRHRFYDCRLGRWLARDPIGYFGGINLYAYALGSPINQTDSQGLQMEVFPIWTNPWSPFDEERPCTAERIQRDKKGYDKCIDEVCQTYDKVSDDWAEAADVFQEGLDEEEDDCKESCEDRFAGNPPFQAICKAACTGFFGVIEGGVIGGEGVVGGGIVAAEGAEYKICDNKYPCHDKNPGEKP